jgi:hypothetical protein
MTKPLFENQFVTVLRRCGTSPMAESCESVSFQSVSCYSVPVWSATPATASSRSVSGGKIKRKFEMRID